MNWLSFYLLNVNRQLVGSLRPTTALDTYHGATKEFHPDGLYSIQTFGPIGSERRDLTFSYFDVGIDIISPAVAMALYDLKHLYKDVMAGKRFAVWDDKLKDFFPAAPTDQGAKTGYSFFMSKYADLTPAPNKSTKRQKNIDLFNKFRDIACSRYVLIVPAGMRDLEVTPDGQEREVDLNKLYKKVLSTGRIVPTLGNFKDSATMDNTRWALQRAFEDVYIYLFNFLDGKKGYQRGKVAQRRLFNGTRNVLAAMDPSSTVMGRPDEMRPTDTIMGMFQGMKSILPVSIHYVRSRYLPATIGADQTMYLVDKKSLNREVVYVRPQDYDMFSTDEGVERLIEKFRSDHIRHKPIEVQGRYLALIYNDGKTFKIFHDINDLPPDRDRRHVRPITYAELLYLSGYDVWNDYFTIVTRFPVAGQGSTYSSTIRMTTTAMVKMLYELEDDWKTTKEKPATDFPLRSVKEFISTMAPHPSRLDGLKADHDGDTGSGDSVYTKEALEENRKMMTKGSYWVTGDGKLRVDAGSKDLIDLVMVNMLGDPR